VIGLQEIGSSSKALDLWYALISFNLDLLDSHYIGIHKYQNLEVATMVFAKQNIKKRITKAIL
jgi:hypothetical protein